jgi:hypothetical protein
VLDPAHIVGVPHDGLDRVLIQGKPGASAHPATLRAYNLDTDAARVECPIRTDGSFEIEVPAMVGNELRLQALNDSGRSLPVDLIVMADGSVALSTRVLADCLLLEPPLSLALTGSAGLLHVHNACTEDVVLIAPVARRPVMGLLLGQAHTWPLALSPNSALGVDIDIQNDRFDEEVFFVEASMPARDRRPITLHRLP